MLHRIYSISQLQNVKHGTFNAIERPVDPSTESKIATTLRATYNLSKQFFGANTVFFGMQISIDEDFLFKNGKPHDITFYEAELKTVKIRIPNSHGSTIQRVAVLDYINDEGEKCRSIANGYVDSTTGKRSKYLGKCKSLTKGTLNMCIVKGEKKYNPQDIFSIVIDSHGLQNGHEIPISDSYKLMFYSPSNYSYFGGARNSNNHIFVSVQKQNTQSTINIHGKPPSEQQIETPEQSTEILNLAGVNP
jgi:hypothetical protein